MFVCMLLIATVFPAVESLKNNAINSTVPSIPLTSMAANWTEKQKLLLLDGTGDVFGSSVSLSGDTALIGALLDDDNGQDSGSAYVFTKESGNQPPVFRTPSPAKGSTNNPLNFTGGIPINDFQGDTFSWTIQCSNEQTNKKTSATNGTGTTVNSSGLNSGTNYYYRLWSYTKKQSLQQYSNSSIVASETTLGAGAIFVSTTGSDTTGNGTIGNPYRTIQKGISVAQPGDTVYVRGGKYNLLQSVSFVRSGTPGNPVTLSGYEDEEAILDGSLFDINHRQGIIDNQHYSYINIFKIKVQNSAEAGISVRDGPLGNIRIENCSTYNTSISGICSYGGDVIPYTELNNITIRNNSVGKSCWGEGQEAITLRYTRDFEVDHNYIYYMENIGIDAKNGSSYGTIHHNVVNQSGADNPWVSSAIYIDSGCWSLNRVCHNVDIYDNVIHGHCNGIKIGCESGGRVENCSIYNNIVYEARVGFRDDNNGLTDGTRYIKNNVKVINNNFINCNWSVFITEPGQNIKNLTLRNNIMSSINNIFQWNTPPSPEEVNNDHNLYKKDPGVSFRGTDYIIGNPGFVNEAAHDYRLTEYSIARNNGSSENAPNFDFLGVSRPQGIGFDIGAYEYISSNVVPSFGTPNPANNSNGNLLSLTWSIPISDANGDTFNWSIQFSLTQYNNANGDSNGTKSCFITDLSYNTTYKVFVNATDGISWTRK